MGAHSRLIHYLGQEDLKDSVLLNQLLSLQLDRFVFRLLQLGDGLIVRLYQLANDFLNTLGSSIQLTNQQSQNANFDSAIFRGAGFLTLLLIFFAIATLCVSFFIFIFCVYVIQPAGYACLMNAITTRVSYACTADASLAGSSGRCLV